MSAAIALLDRVARAGGRLLRVERIPAPAPRCSRAVRFTFDVGVVELRGGDRALEAGALSSAEPPDALSRSADEEEPWWSVLGEPLVRVTSLPDAAVCLQFRPDGARPKRIALAPEAGAVAWRLED